MPVRLVETGWDGELAQAVAEDHSSLRIVCPFIKLRAAERLLEAGRPDDLRVITRFDLNNFAQGVSDIAALRLLLDNGAVVRGLKGLHAKLYLFGAGRAIVSSANLTEAGLTSNYELGFVCSGSSVVGRCQRYFDSLWLQTQRDLTANRLIEWDERINASRRTFGSFSRPTGLGDEGETGQDDRPPPQPPLFSEPPQAWVKFFGRNLERAPRSMLVLDEMRRSGCHRICSYPKNKRPRRVAEGAEIFMGRLVANPNDILIFGRAVASRYLPGQDDANQAEINLRSWKVNWPHQIRVRDGQYLAGTLADGVSLYQLMDELGAESLASTQEHARAGQGNINPRDAYPRHADVRLSREGQDWISRRLNQAFSDRGLQQASDLACLDWL